MIHSTLQIRTAAFLAFSFFGMAGLSTSSAASVETGAAVFKTKCGACHGPDAAGQTALGQRMKLRDLRSPEVQKQSDDELTAAITNGRGAMPGFGKTLDPDTIHSLVLYVRSLAAKKS